jgi:hypothetical protein
VNLNKKKHSKKKTTEYEVKSWNKEGIETYSNLLFNLSCSFPRCEAEKEARGASRKLKEERARDMKRAELDLKWNPWVEERENQIEIWNETHEFFTKPMFLGSCKRKENTVFTKRSKPTWLGKRTGQSMLLH